MLIEEIKREIAWMHKAIERSSLHESTIKALETVPRDKFVDSSLEAKAYDNTPLPIGYGQTISQPLIVALMTDVLDLSPTDRVLEIGSGSGYQAAILSHIVKEVYTIEVVEPLGKMVAERFESLGYKNIFPSIGDGYHGLKDKAPFDGIIVTAAASHVPPALISQLKIGGRMVIPVGGPFQVQNLLLITKTAKGLDKKTLIPVRFVPFTGAIDKTKTEESKSDDAKAK